MLTLDRGDFWGSEGPNGQRVLNPNSYVNSPQQIGFNVVISAPCLHAHALEMAQDILGPGGRVLDIGAGTGILCAGFYELAKNNDLSTKVFGIEHMQGLC